VFSRRRAAQDVARLTAYAEQLEAEFDDAPRESSDDYLSLIRQAQEVSNAWRVVARAAYGGVLARDSAALRTAAEHATRKAVEWRQRELDLDLTRRHRFGSAS
jgi:hypothetical protein